MNTLEDKQGKVTITRQKDGGKKINVEPLNNSFIPTKTCETNYPLNLIGLIFEIKGSSYLCDEIRRDVDPNYVQRDLEMDLTGYFTKQDFVGKKILDFGCGSARLYDDFVENVSGRGNCRRRARRKFIENCRSPTRIL
jgi:hypothetical protein